MVFLAPTGSRFSFAAIINPPFAGQIEIEHGPTATRKQLPFVLPGQRPNKFQFAPEWPPICDIQERATRKRVSFGQLHVLLFNGHKWKCVYNLIKARSVIHIPLVVVEVDDISRGTTRFHPRSSRFESSSWHILPPVCALCAAVAVACAKESLRLILGAKW